MAQIQERVSQSSSVNHEGLFFLLKLEQD